MNILLTTSLAGSLVMGWYVILKLGMGKRFFPKFKQIVLKLSVIFFLVPIGLFYDTYTGYLNSLTNNYVGSFLNSWAYTNGEKFLKNVVEVSSSGEVLYIQNREFYYLLGAFTAILIVFLDKQLNTYLKSFKNIFKASEKVDDKEIVEILNHCQKQVGLKRKVQIKVLKNSGTPFVIGILRPCIIISNETLSKENYEMIFLHELYHIKNNDLIWKIIALVAVAANWYNPIAYYMRREINICCETRCDERIVVEKDLEYRKNYGRLIITMAEEVGTTPSVAAAFGKAGKHLKVRINDMLFIKKPSFIEKISSFIIVLIIIVSNSCTILAYDAPDVVYVDQMDTGLDSVKTEYSDTSFSISLEALGDPIFSSIDQGFTMEGATKMESVDGNEIYAMFVDMEGNIYPVKEVIDGTVNTDAITCEHNYVKGYYKVHTKNSNGSCVLVIYNAQICTICNQVVRGSVYSTTTYAVCPH